MSSNEDLFMEEGDAKAPPRFDLESPDIKSDVLTVTPKDHIKT